MITFIKEGTDSIKKREGKHQVLVRISHHIWGRIIPKTENKDTYKSHNKKDSRELTLLPGIS